MNHPNEPGEAEFEIQADRVCLRHAGADRDAVRDLSISVRRGEILVLAGPNGSGKSTLLAGLAGLLPARRGEIRVDGLEMRRWSKRRLARRVASLPQDPVAAEGVTAEEIVRSGRHAWVPRFGSMSRADEQAVERAFTDLDLGDLRRRPAETLSGGERRRVFIAMALAQESDILLLDEPTAALDLRQQWEVLALLSKINLERGTTIVTSLHDLEQAAGLAHRMALLHRGRLYALASPETCLQTEALRDVYGVDAVAEKTDGRFTLTVRGPADPVRNL